MRPVAIRQAMPEASARAIGPAVRGDGWNVSSSTVPSRSITTARTRARRARAAAAALGAAGIERSTCRRPTPRTRRRSRRPGRRAASPASRRRRSRSARRRPRPSAVRRSSRSGPTSPLVPASSSAWQPPQVATNAVLPAATSAPEPPPVVVSAGPSRSRSSSVSPVFVVSVVVVAGRLRPPAAVDGSTVSAVVPWPIVISPEMVVSATFDEKQPVAPTATAARTRSSGRSRRARMPNSLPSLAAESVGDRPAPADRG